MCCAFLLRHYYVVQAFSALALEVHFPAEFRSNPDQTHLNKLIKVFRITRKLQAGSFNQRWHQTLQESGSRRPELNNSWTPDFVFKMFWLITRMFLDRTYQIRHLEGRCPAEFSSNPNKSNLGQVIQGGVLKQVVEKLRATLTLEEQDWSPLL